MPRPRGSGSRSLDLTQRRSRKASTRRIDSGCDACRLGNSRLAGRTEDSKILGLPQCPWGSGETVQKETARAELIPVLFLLQSNLVSHGGTVGCSIASSGSSICETQFSSPEELVLSAPTLFCNRCRMNQPRS